MENLPVCVARPQCSFPMGSGLAREAPVCPAHYRHLAKLDTSSRLSRALSVQSKGFSQVLAAMPPSKQPKTPTIDKIIQTRNPRLRRWSPAVQPQRSPPHRPPKWPPTEIPGITKERTTLTTIKVPNPSLQGSRPLSRSTTKTEAITP